MPIEVLKNKKFRHIRPRQNSKHSFSSSYKRSHLTPRRNRRHQAGIWTINGSAKHGKWLKADTCTDPAVNEVHQRSTRPTRVSFTWRKIKMQYIVQWKRRCSQKKHRKRYRAYEAHNLQVLEAEWLEIYHFILSSKKQEKGKEKIISRIYPMDEEQLRTKL